MPILPSAYNHEQKRIRIVKEIEVIVLDTILEALQNVIISRQAESNDPKKFVDDMEPF